jgi:hypothetical protein
MEWIEAILFETEGSKVIASMQPPDPSPHRILENASYSHTRGAGRWRGKMHLVKSLACILTLHCSSEESKSQKYLCKTGKE